MHPPTIHYPPIHPPPPTHPHHPPIHPPSTHSLTNHSTHSLQPTRKSFTPSIHSTTLPPPYPSFLPLFFPSTHPSINSYIHLPSCIEKRKNHVPHLSPETLGNGVPLAGNHSVWPAFRDPQFPKSIPVHTDGSSGPDLLLLPRGSRTKEAWPHHHLHSCLPTALHWVPHPPLGFSQCLGPREDSAGLSPQVTLDGTT